ncbi:MAG: protein kinase [Acidobacteriota bacterium]
MDAEKWQKVKSILEKALEIIPESRSAFLDESCADDEDLRLEIENLLAFEEPEADLLEQEAVASILENDSTAKKLIGNQIGHYKIIDELGVGGMGAVFLAERADGEFQQKVALKLIKRGMDSEAVLRRFITERQILDSLEHPNIAHLIDGGTTNDGLPYFVMEYVEGVSIVEFAEINNLNLEERLNLFREVCSAVSFAHQNLVIHRDLKPSNILITKDEKAKLLDFGIAKVLKPQEENQTATQNFAFTPEYASPEQVRGEKLTTMTDIYSLGVILYELLTGSRPYQTESKNISEIIKAVCETEPARPSSVSPKSQVSSLKSENQTANNNAQNTKDGEQQTNPKSKIQNPKSLRGDLDNIILKSLRKEPERRYSSVEQFSEDIRRHQTGLPVTASADTWSYRASKFVQRNRIGVAAAALILVTLFGGLFATLYQRNKAQRRFNDVRQLANSFLFEFHDAIKDLPGSTPARELVVKRAIEYLDQLAAESEGDLTLQRELGTAYAEIGQIQGNSYHSNLGDTEGAMKSYRRSLEIRQKLADADPKNLDYQHELADSHEGVGDMLYTVNDLKGGLEFYEKAVVIREKIVAATPTNLEYRYSLANIYGKRGDIKGMEGFPNLGDVTGALESYRQGVKVYEELVNAQPENEKFKSGYATMLHYMGMLQTTTGDSKGAIANGQKALSIFDSLIAANPNNAKYETHKMSGLVFMRYPLLDEGRTAEAIENARQVVSTMEKQVAADPKNSFARRSLGVSYNSLAKCLLQAGDAKSAIENHQRSLKIAEELSAANPTNAENHRDTSLTKQFLAEAQAVAGDSEPALSNFRESISFLESELKKDDSNIQIKEDMASCLVEIGKILTVKGDLANAIEHFRRALPFAEDALQKNSGSNRVKSRYANHYFEAGKTFAKLAQKENSEKTKAEACNYLTRSFNVWNEMKQAGTLSTFNANRPDEVAKEMAQCK